MADNELLIKISADAKNAVKAFDDVREQTEDLEKQLGTVAKISAVGFAALTAEIGFSLKAFGEAEEAARTLNTTLQAQGIYTEELAAKYKSYATEVQNATGIDADLITAAQATAQSYLGQTEITKELTLSIADLAAKKKIDLNSAAALVAKTIGTETNALARDGLQLDENATRAERMAKTLEFLEGRYKGQAEAAGKAFGGIAGLTTAFGNLQEEIGARFAPTAEIVIKSITNVFRAISENKALVDLTVSMLAAGVAITGLGLAIPAVVTSLGILRAALAAFQIQTTATKLAIQGLIGATGIGLLVVALTELALNWDTVSKRVKVIVQGLVQFVSVAFSGLGEVLSGAMNLNLETIKSGLDKIKNAFKAGIETASAEIPKGTEKAIEEQDKVLKAAADKRAAADKEEQSRKRQLASEENQLLTLQLQQASATEIEIQRAKIETLKQLDKTQNTEQRELLQEKYDELNDSQEEQADLEAERRLENAELEKESREETGTEELEDLTVFQEQRRQQVEAGLLTEQEAKQKALNDELTDRIAAQNKMKVEQQKYGVAYAAINKVITSDEVEGTKKATGELVQLTQSKNATLKSIGKAAAVAQIVIKTAESAMAIYAGFSAIPIIGPALGVAGAAAAVAFGAEQVGNVTAAQDGALVPGFGSGDTVPFMLEPGELVAPRRNFEEVVAGTQMVRGLQEGNGIGGPVEVMIGFDGREAAKILTARQNEDRALGLSTAGG